MSLDLYQEIALRQQEAQRKQSQFLMASAGACIGFAMTQIKNELIAIEMAFLIAAVLCWCLSFFLGCRYMDCSIAASRHNAAALEAGELLNAVDPQEAIKAKIGLDTYTQHGRSQNVIAARHYRWQIRFIACGVIFYIAGKLSALYLAAS